MRHISLKLPAKNIFRLNFIFNQINIANEFIKCFLCKILGLQNDKITNVTLTAETLYLFKKYTNFETTLSNCTLYTKQVKKSTKIK